MKLFICRLMDPYVVLDLPRNATLAQIKKSYRELTMLYHPDRDSSHQAEKKMLELNAAYKILKDPETRKIFDNGGIGAIDGMDESNISANSRIGRCRPVETELDLTVSDIYNGVTKFITVTVNDDELVRNKKIPITVSSNFDFNRKVIVKGQGSSRPGYLKGDIVITLNRRADPKIDNFEIDRYDLIYRKTLRLGEIMGEYEFPIKHPNREVILIKGKLVKPEETLIVSGYGMPLPDDNKSLQTHGNLIIDLKFDFSSLALANRRELAQIRKFLNGYRATSVPAYKIPDDAKPVEYERRAISLNKPDEPKDSGSDNVDVASILRNIPGLNNYKIPGLNAPVPGVTTTTKDGQNVTTRTTTTINVQTADGHSVPECNQQ